MHGRRSSKPKIFDLDQYSYSKAEYPIISPQKQPTPMAQPNIADQPKLLKDYLNPSIGVELFDKPSCSHDIKPGIFQILPNFNGNINEDPYDHLQEVSKICFTIKDADDALRLALLPFSFLISFRDDSSSIYYHKSNEIYLSLISLSISDSPLLLYIIYTSSFFLLTSILLFIILLYSSSLLIISISPLIYNHNSY